MVNNKNILYKLISSDNAKVLYKYIPVKEDDDYIYYKKNSSSKFIYSVSKSYLDIMVDESELYSNNTISVFSFNKNNCFKKNLKEIHIPF